MSRYRPPQPKSSPYITAEGYSSLELELRDIWKKRAEVTKALSAAAAEGDRSENAEYIYRKKELAGLDRRIRYLQRRMPSLTIVSKVARPEQVYFSAWVLLEKPDGSEVEYRIVGADEIESDSRKGYISVDSPLARGLLGKQIDDEVTVHQGPNALCFVVLSIRYQ